MELDIKILSIDIKILTLPINFFSLIDRLKETP